MFSEEESFFEEKTIPIDNLSWNFQEYGDLFIKDFPPLPIPSDESQFIHIISEKNEGIPFQEEIANLVIEIPQIDINNVIKEKPNQFRGRKRKNSRSIILESRKKFHDKFRADNIFIKVKAHYQNFIIDFFNIFLEAFDFKEKFIKISYVYIKTFNKSNFDSFKNLSISKILEQDISPKYSTKNRENNINIINKIKTNFIVNNMLSETYIDLFRNIYYKSERNINLKKYGLDKIIELPKYKVQMFSDLIEKFNKKEDQKYIERLNDYVKKKFLN